jgi:uncharacterized protein YecE (DUF72 family)
MTRRLQPRVRVGVSGWRYAPWRGVFYPRGLPQRLELSYAAGMFPTLEINGSFYSLQSPQSWREWYAATPDDFVFAVKGPRYITHMLKLRGVEQPLANFFASGLLALGGKLGPVLWQFPPSQRFDADRFGSFLALLPRDTEQALRLARRRHPRMHGRSHLRIDQARPLKYAMEIRHESFLDPRFIALLRTHNVALVIAETARQWPMPRDVTADFMYLRLHGDRDLYRSGYGPAAIRNWARRISAWHRGTEPTRLPPDAVRVAPRMRVTAAAGRDVFCYFDNTDVKLRAPRDARSLMRELAVTAPVSSRSPAPTNPRRAPDRARRKRGARRAARVRRRSRR